MRDTLTNKRYRDYGYISRYSTTPIYYSENDHVYLSGTSHQLNDTAYLVHIAETNDTYDSLALRYYGNPTLYWIICDYNKIQDSYSSIKRGDKIYIPTLSNISFNINGREL